MGIFERILSDTLKPYLLLREEEADLLLKSPSNGIKERVGTINDLQVIIYSNDHDPPHFHVKTKDLKIDAKFRIKDCALVSGNIGSKDIKKIKAFFLSPKGRLIMEKIWNKRK